MEKKQTKKKRTGLYVIGSLAFAAGVMVVAPMVIDILANQFEKHPQQTLRDDDDWGPEIVRREKTMKENKDGEL